MTTILKKPESHKRDQIAQSLREMAGALSPGDRLPSAIDVRQRFGVAAGTVEAAMELLRREGLVERRRGSGTFVARHGAGTGMSGERTGERERTRVASGLVAVLASGKFPYVQNCVEQLSAQAPTQKMRLVCHYGDYENDPQRALQDALELESLHPAGFVLTFAHLAPIARTLLNRGHRAVVIGLPPHGESSPVPCVDGDHEHGAALAAGRLLDLGHRRIIFVHGFEREERLRESRRWEGHRRTLVAAGIAETDIHCAYLNLGAQNPDTDAVVQLFCGPDAPTGAVVWNDDEAVRLLSLLRQAGLRVPEDISVIGYGNVPLGEHSHPPLDTVDQHMEIQVRYALTLLNGPRENLTGSAVPTTSVTPTLQVRRSCASPPTKSML